MFIQIKKIVGPKSTIYFDMDTKIEVSKLEIAILTATDIIQQTASICANVSQVSKQGYFPLRKWIFNTHQVRHHINDDAFRVLHFPLEENVKTLWFTMSCQSNTFNVHWLYETLTTNKNVLSSIARMFNPLGLVSPFTDL